MDPLVAHRMMHLVITSRQANCQVKMSALENSSRVGLRRPMVGPMRTRAGAAGDSASAPEPEALAAGLAEALEGGGQLTTEARQRLFAALVRLYALSRRSATEQPFAVGAVAVEDVVLTAAEMLRAAEVTSFELAALFNV